MEKAKKAYSMMRAALRRLGGFALLPALLLCVLALTADARAADYRYMLELATGEATGDEKDVRFFIVTYDAVEGGTANQHSTIVFTNADSLKTSYQTAKADEQKNRDEYIYARYGYRADASTLEGRTPFQPYQVDQYLFTTPNKIGRIDNIKIFVGSRGTWTSQGIRVFRVDKLGGVYRCNDLASETYIDFEGELIAEACRGGKNISWTSDKLVGVSRRDSAQYSPADLELQTEFDEEYKAHPMQHDTGKTMAIRFDFADAFGAGLECLSLSKGTNTLDKMRPVEDMLLNLRYVDRYGTTRTAAVPGVINAVELASSLGANGDTPLAGLAQQGESIVVSVFLPDFGSFSETATVNLVLGAKTVRETCKFTASDQSMETASMNDGAAILTAAVYLLNAQTDGISDANAPVSAKADASAGAIRYEFRNKPYAFFSAGSVGGESVIVGPNGITLRAFAKGDILTREESKADRFLIELATDDVPQAGTSSDILMSIAYTDLEGKKQQSGTIKVRERAKDFYGYWPGNREDFGYFAGVAQGQKLRFVVTLPKAKEITDAKVWIEGKTGDEWQMADFTISTIKEGPLKREVSWEGVSLGGLTSDRRFDRYVNASVIYEYNSDAGSAILIQPGQEAEAIGPRPDGGAGGGIDVTTRQEQDWSQLRYNMTYEEASQDLGFTSSVVKYKVAVHVGNTIVSTSGNGDSGSKNLFHFRLIFEGGTSGFVLANQQLSGDGFRANQIETFTIPTNRDYGDVTAVQIVPDDVSGDSDKFDKLEIDSIEITKTVNASLSPTWTISKVGWIGIDYRDEGASESIRGQKGRSAEELTQTYLVDGSTYSLKLMVAIQTDSYDSPDEQFRGALTADVYYDHYSASTEPGSTGDIVEAMYEYQRRAKNYSEEVGGMAVSDPDWMFRANHTDRFIFELRDVKQINRMVFHARGTSSVNWNLSGVAIYLVNGPGKIRLNANSEYEQFYEAGQELTPLAYSTSEFMPYAYSQHIEKYNNDSANPNSADIMVNFTGNQIELSPDAKQWTSVISREPTSRNDTLNIFLWPEASTGASAYGTVARIVYSDVDGRPQQASTGPMNLALYNGEPVFYATNVRTTGLAGISSITVSSGNGENFNGIRRGLIQRVRSGVVVKSWEVGGSGLSDLGIVLSELPKTTAEEQRVLLQLGADTENAALHTESMDSGAKAAPKDLAVALWYLPDNPVATELRTPYVYLTDQGFTEIHPGQLIELKFDHLNIAEVTGITVVAVGSVKTSIDAAHVTNRQLSREDGALVRVKGEYSFAQPITVSDVPNRMNPAGSVSPVTITFLTDKSQENVSGGTSGPVRMTLGYYDQYGSMHRPTYEDLRMYIQSGDRSFRADQATSVKLLVPDIDELRWIELEPYKERKTDDAAEMQNEAAQGGTAKETVATWKLKEVKLRIGETGSEADRSVGQTIVEGKPMRLSMADILLSANVFVGENTDAQTMTGGSLDVQLKSGEKLRVVTSLIGSGEGLEVKLESYEPTTGAVGNADLGDTRGYTKELLAQKAAQAASEEEAAIWRSTEPQPGALAANEPADVTFTPPRNYTEGDLGYRLTIRSRESANAAVVLNVTVKNESDPTKKTIEDFMQEMIRLQKENEARIKNLQDQVNSSSGGSSDLTGAGENP